MNTTKKDIETAVDELRAALMESVEASEAEDMAKLRKTKAQKRLTLARDAVRALSVN